MRREHATVNMDSVWVSELVSVTNCIDDDGQQNIVRRSHRESPPGLLDIAVSHVVTMEQRPPLIGHILTRLRSTRRWRPLDYGVCYEIVQVPPTFGPLFHTQHTITIADTACSVTVLASLVLPVLSGIVHLNGSILTVRNSLEEFTPSRWNSLQTKQSTKLTNRNIHDFYFPYAPL